MSEHTKKISLVINSYVKAVVFPVVFVALIFGLTYLLGNHTPERLQPYLFLLSFISFIPWVWVLISFAKDTAENVRKSFVFHALFLLVFYLLQYIVQIVVSFITQGFGMM